MKLTRAKIEVGQIWFTTPRYYWQKNYEVMEISDFHAYYINHDGNKEKFCTINEDGTGVAVALEYGWHFKWSPTAFCQKGCGLHKSECKCT